jgi:hypothetical protein
MAASISSSIYSNFSLGHLDGIGISYARDSRPREASNSGDRPSTDVINATVDAVWSSGLSIVAI